MWVLLALTQLTLAHFCGEIASNRIFRMETKNESSKDSVMVARYVDVMAAKLCQGQGLICTNSDPVQSHNYFDAREFQKDRNLPQIRHRYLPKCSMSLISLAPGPFRVICFEVEKSCGLCCPCSLFFDCAMTYMLHVILHTRLSLFGIQLRKAGWSLRTRLFIGYSLFACLILLVHKFNAILEP